MKKSSDGKPYRAFFLIYILVCCFKISFPQGIAKDASGQACINGHTILACWNFEAGKNIPEDENNYPEYLPFLKGWDFRVNLPHVKFQLAKEAAGSVPVMVGVVEATPTETGIECGAGISSTLHAYGHTNNSIWLFKTLQQNKKIYYKVLPSRRNLNSSDPENVSSLTQGWVGINIQQPVNFKIEKPAVAVVGKGIGATVIYIVARDQNNMLFFSKRTMSSTSTASWPETWTSLNIHSSVSPAVSVAFDNKLALSFCDTENNSVKVQLYDAATNNWSVPTIITGLTAPCPLRLLWDSTALNLFALSGSFIKQAYTTTNETPLNFSVPTRVSNSPITGNAGFRVIFFNNRMHLVFNTGNVISNRVFYTTTTSGPGRPPVWTGLSYVGFTSQLVPDIANLYEHIFIIGKSHAGRIIYSRKDPNKAGIEITGDTGEDQWLDRGMSIDPTIPGLFSNFEALSFNSDVYVVANKNSMGSSPAGTYIINFSRAAMKYLLINKWGMRLTHGSEPSKVKAANTFAKGAETPLIGDFDGDNDDDLIKFNRVPETNVGFAPVYVSLNNNGTFEENKLWHKFFAPPGEIPMVGDFNGDGKDDIITFTQQKQYDAGGNEIGPAVVWVALSNGTGFEPSKVWHKFFSLKGEIPMVGDFNGDGKDDIITFTQKKQLYADGSEIGPAVVWVALSTGTKFEGSSIWHKFFSLKGEIPRVGDFNGDGKSDIVSFVQHSQNYSNGSLLGLAPVWVSLSTGTKFQTSTVWHKKFSLNGEIPAVGDMNMDGKDDIVSFIHGAITGERSSSVYVAYSLASKFDKSNLWQSDFVNNEQQPFIGHGKSNALNYITSRPQDKAFFPDIFAFRNDGAVHISKVMYNVPYPAGAPWERYKWFTEKATGVAQFPEWIYQRAGHCISVNHNFILSGASGSGSDNTTISSVRFGGRAGHILQEVGHSVFANCFREVKDPFNFFNSIFVQNYQEGGFGAGFIADECVEDSHSDYYDCRPEERMKKAEHIFLGLMVNYRLNGNEFRERIKTEPNMVYRAQLRAAYRWLKTNWYKNIEYKKGIEVNASLIQDGVPCLTGECQ